ncbi:hypothetical protein PCO82_06435 [Pectobacteriaceae bacterium CE90]|nr:hypothetical protein PCO82_06435 [Pectobacteriaceae bacterium CE90]
MFIVNAILAILTILLVLLSVVNSARNGFYDIISGLIVGVLVFIAMPLVMVFAFGEIPPSFLSIDTLTLHENNGIYFFIFLFVSLILLVNVLTKNINFTLKPIIDKSISDKCTDIFAFLVIGLYFFLTVIIVLSTNKISGGHWNEASQDMYENSLVSVVLGNFSNVYRVIYPMILALLRVDCKISKKTYSILLLLYLVIELVFVNNRIVVLFAVMSLAYVNKKRLVRFSLACMIISPFVAFINYAYPIARGLMWVNGFSIQGISDAFSLAIAYRMNERSNGEGSFFAEIFNNLFEAFNMNVFKYVYNTFGHIHDFYYGKTVLLRSFSFFIPSSIWPGKPAGIGVNLGNMITGENILTLNSTPLGEFYGNFGWYSLIFAPALFFIVWLISRPLLGVKSMSFCLFMISFAALRFDFSFIMISIFTLYVTTLMTLAIYLFRYPSLR